MAQENGLDDLDQRLLHALQMNPRAAWVTIAPIVGADPVTLARRWQRLADLGMAYVTAYMVGAENRAAFVELECAPRDTLAVAEELAGHREAASIDLTAGARNVLVNVTAADESLLHSWLLDRTRTLHRVRAMRIHLVTDRVTDARNWRLRALSPAEVRAVRATDPRPPARRSRLDGDRLRELVTALNADGRASATVLADRVGVSPRTVRDAIADLRASGRLVLRMDVARSSTAWPVLGYYFLRVPTPVVHRVGQQLGQLDEVRAVVSTVGECNIFMAVWLRALGDVQRLEAQLEEKLPGIVIADRSVVLRTYKQVGHLLDARGYATGAVVPLAIPA